MTRPVASITIYNDTGIVPRSTPYVFPFSIIAPVASDPIYILYETTCIRSAGRAIYQSAALDKAELVNFIAFGYLGG